MSQVPSQLKYATTHEWLQTDADGTVTVGITEHAQDLLGELVFVELPAIDTEVTAKQEVAVVESVKAASDVYSPITGVVIAINQALIDQPELINKDPYGEGWLFRLRPTANIAENDLLTAEAYQQIVAEEGH
ncbi:glycine cleavage system protein GcvH [soil metagenome]